MKQIYILKQAFLVLFLLVNHPFYAQQKIIDSLERIVNARNVSDKDKIIPLSQLCAYYSGNLSKSINTGNKSVVLARKQTDKKYGVYAYSNLGLTYSLEGNFDKIYNSIDSCKWFIKNSSDLEAHALGWNRIGAMKIQMGDKEGLNDLYKSLGIIKNVQNKSKIAWIAESSDYYLLSTYYSSDLKKMDQYSKLSLEAAKKSKWPNSLCLSWSMRGIYYLTEFGTNSKMESLNKAIQCLNESLNTYEKNVGYVRDVTYMSVLLQLTYAYQFKYEDSKQEEDLQKINHYVEKANKIAVNNNDIEFQVNYHQLLILAETSKKDYSAALQFTKNILQKLDAQKTLFNYKYDFSIQQSTFYEKLGLKDEALASLKNAQSFYQKYFDEKYIKAGQLYEVKYKLLEKEQEIILSKKQNQWYTIIGVVFLLLLIVLVSNFRIRLKYLKQKKEEANSYAKIKEEEAKLLVVEKENAILHAQLKEKEAQKFQKEILAQQMQVSHKNKILEDLHKKTKEDPQLYPVILNRLIKNESLLDKNFDDFKEVLNNIHPEFYSNLQNKANTKLTSLDLKYCVYIFMRMPSKEMSELLHVELKTIRMNKYRLKRKFGLEKDQDLDLFIQNIV